MAGSRGIFRWRVLRWLVLVFPLALIAILYPIDRAYKQSDIAGYVPAETMWSIASNEGPAFWAHAEASPEYAAFEDELGKPLMAFERETHLRTGIRPTASRWRLWMGDAVAVSERGGAVGFCVRPGVLLRGVHIARSLVGRSADDGVFSFGDLHYRWHEGYLIASRDTAYFDGEWAARMYDGSRAVHIAHRLNDESIEIAIEADAGFPAELTLPHRTAIQSTEAAPIRRIPDGAIATIQSPAPHSLLPLWFLVQHYAGKFEFLGHVIDGPGIPDGMAEIPELPKEDIDGIFHSTMVVYGLDMEGYPTFLPRGYLVTQAKEGIPHPVSRSGSGYPFEWEGVAGEMRHAFRAWGDLALVSEGTSHYTVTGDPLMTRVMAEPLAESAPSTDVVVFIDWEGVGDELQRAARRLTDDDIGMEPMEYRAVEADIMPLLRALTNLGHADLSGDIDDERIILTGTLTSAE